ncbi:MAG: alpha/beta fold hydrolase [Gammaproteobacteria bacterium]|nr:alpha/beta fold hydrolase [Gammaproteobacteria bacterium]MCW8994093.1 alpha/beta fold hydrolase [Gammaproteobacteria bacterium]
MKKREAIVLVHGLWMRGPEMYLLRRRLQKAGYAVYQFSYRSVAGTLEENARQLNAFVQEFEGETVHFVAHSLGGLVVRRLFHDFPHQRPGRIVTLGTPHSGSYVANRLSRSGLFRKLLGCSLVPLSGELYPWPGDRELGSIAGSLSVGVGWLVRDLSRPNDGTVAVAETRLEGMTDHLVVHTSHMAMLLSKKVAGQTLHFLRHGRFDRN